MPIMKRSPAGLSTASASRSSLSAWATRLAARKASPSVERAEAARGLLGPRLEVGDRLAHAALAQEGQASPLEGGRHLGRLAPERLLEDVQGSSAQVDRFPVPAEPQR
jgi:hypothetical protein